MKISKSITIFCFLLLFQSCISQDRKLESKKYTQLAEDLIKNNLSYTDTLTGIGQREFEKALNYTNEAIALDSFNLRAYKDKQTVLTNLDKEVDTLTLFKILKLQPDFAEEYVVLGGIYERLKKSQLAKDAYSKAKLIYLSIPASDERNLNLIVIEFLITNNRTKALEKLKQFPIQNSDLKKTLRLQIDEIEKGRNKDS